MLTALDVSASSNVRAAAPHPAFLDLDGAKKTLHDFRGKVLLVNFWASWCPPCIREMPSLMRLARHMQDEEFAVVMVNVDEPPGIIARFGRVAESGVWMLRDADAAVALEWGVTAFPTSFLLDRDHDIREHIPGEQVWDEPSWLSRFEDLLAE
jgi:thiol-disulfide isomerase/thioredoxin